MATDDIIIRLFCMVDDHLGPVKKRSDAKLHDSEIVTIGMLFALRGGQYRPFYRWLRANYRQRFPQLPEQSRLHRLLAHAAPLTDGFLAEPTTFTIADTYGIELIHPRRAGRSPQQIGKKGLANGRWIVGITLAWLINAAGQVVSWQWDTANVADKTFRELALTYDGETIVLCDYGFRERGEESENMRICARGTWNERYAIETQLSRRCLQLNLKKMYHRVRTHIDARLSYVAALMHCLIALSDTPGNLTAFVI